MTTKKIRQARVLCDVQKGSLVKEFSRGEVWDALIEIDDSKMAGSNEYTAFFSKQAWLIVGDEVTDAVMHFFETEVMTKEINSMILYLAAKVENPSTSNNFRPIACCNVISKTVSKMLCSRLKQVLPDIISPSQSAFVAQRNIIDNILLCQDLGCGYD